MKTILFKLLLLITVLFIISSDLLAQVNWTKYADNPILKGGPSGNWNHSVVEASVLYNADSSRFEMWFVGTSGSPVFPYRVGFATSIDGLTWEMHPNNPVLSPGSTGEWDAYTVEFPYVIRENGQYKMWYSSGGSNYIQYKIGFATSPDGINWTKYANNPILGFGTEPWEAGGVMACTVLPVSGGYKMWYTGLTTAGQNGTCAIGYANSTDGISWERNNNPVLVPSVSGEWDDTWVLNPDVLLIDNQYYMWYVGADNNSFLFEIGLATSYNGINWEKHSSNPVLQTSPGQWDGISVGCGTVLFMGDSLCMWYHGMGSFWQIGLATSSPFIPIPVELVSFTAKSNGKEVILNWSTATELNNQLFEIQRSFEGNDFVSVGFVNGKGTTTERQDYTYRDKILADGKYSYRLKQIDYLGRYEYSVIIEIDLRVFNTFLLEQNYPNPFNPTTTIGYGIKEKCNVKVTILNSIGEEVAMLVNEEKESGYHTVEFNASSLPSGVYFYQLKAGSFIETKKMILLK